MKMDTTSKKISRRTFTAGAAGSALLTGCETQPLLQSIKDGAANAMNTASRSLGNLFKRDPYREAENTQEMKEKAFNLVVSAQKSNTLDYYLHELKTATKQNEAGAAKLRDAVEAGKAFSFLELAELFEKDAAPAFRALANAYSVVDRATKPNRAKRIKGNQYLLEPGTGLRHTQTGKCMDPKKPAPTTGELLEVRYIDSRLHENLRPVFKALCEQTPHNNKISSQTLTWIILSAGDPEGYCAGVLNQTYISQLNSIYPNGGNIVQGHHNLNAMILKKVQREMDNGLAKLFNKPVGYIDRNNRTQIDQEVDRQLGALIAEGLKNQGDGQPGYTLIGANVATRAVGSGTLASTQTIINAGSEPVLIDLTDLYAEPRRNRQAISGVPGSSAPTLLTFPEKVTAAQRQELEAEAKKNAAAAKAWSDLMKQSLLTGVTDVDALLKLAPISKMMLNKFANNKGMQTFLRALGTGLPLVGTALSAYEAAFNKNWLTQEPLGAADRMLAIAGIFPGAGAIASAAKISTGAGKLMLKPVADKVASFLTKAAGTQQAKSWDTAQLIGSNMTLASQLINESNANKFKSFYESTNQFLKKIF